MFFIKNNLKLFTFALLNSIIGVTLIFVFYLADANKLRATPPSVNNFKLARKSVVHIKTTVSHIAILGNHLVLVEQPEQVSL